MKSCPVEYWQEKLALCTLCMVVLMTAVFVAGVLTGHFVIR
jgi:hypothetical protein